MNLALVWIVGLLSGQAYAAEIPSWVLHGTIYNETGTRYAILAMDGKPRQYKFREGRALPLGWKLEQVLVDAVEVSQSGIRQRLPFGAVLSAPPKPLGVKRSSLLSLADNLPALIKSVEVRPNIDKGMVKGFRLHRFRGEALGIELGLQEGDVITHINGDELTTRSRGNQLFQRYQDSEQLRLSLIRAGQPMELTIEIRE